MTDDKIVAYITSPVKGNWNEHPKLAHSNLEIIIDVLKHEGFINDYGKIITSREFGFPYDKPNILELKDNFFGNAELGVMAKEVEEVREDKSFFKKLIDDGHYGEGYFIVRVEGDKNFRNRFQLSLDGRLDAIKEMHGMGYIIVKSSEGDV